MDKSANRITGLALGSLCVALVWTIQGSEPPKPVLPASPPVSPAPQPLLPPPDLKHKAEIAAFAEAYLKYSPELERVLKGVNEFPGVSFETSDL